MKRAIQCKYSCNPCGIKMQVFTVRARENGEDIDVYLDAVVLVAMKDHAERSPNCPARKFDELMIPIAGDVETGVIGGVV